MSYHGAPRGDLAPGLAPRPATSPLSTPRQRKGDKVLRWCFPPEGRAVYCRRLQPPESGPRWRQVPKGRQNVPTASAHQWLCRPFGTGPGVASVPAAEAAGYPLSSLRDAEEDPLAPYCVPFSVAVYLGAGRLPLGSHLPVLLDCHFGLAGANFSTIASLPPPRLRGWRAFRTGQSGELVSPTITKPPSGHRAMARKLSSPRPPR